MKKIMKTIIVLIMLILCPKNALAENTYKLGINCEPTQVVADDATKKYTSCAVTLDNSESIVSETDKISIRVNYNQIKNGNDLTITAGELESFLGQVSKDENGASFVITMGAVPKEKFTLFNVKLVVNYSTPTPNSGAKIKASGEAGEAEVELEFTDTYSLDLSSYTDVCKKLTLDVGKNRKAIYAKENGYMYAIYKIENIKTDYEQCYGLAGIRGTVDLSTLPEGLKLVDGFISEVNSDEVKSIASMQLNPENGQWVIDFDLATKSLDIQAQNNLTFALKYEISDSSKVADSFSTTMKDFSFVKSSDIETSYYPKVSLISDFQAGIKGDWNSNGSFELIDLIKYRKYLVEPYVLDEKLLQIVDLNSDGEINLLDLIAARKVLVGLPID